MKHTYLVAFSAVLLSGVSVIPAYASTTVSCSDGGNFTVSGNIVTRTNPALSSTCTGIASIPASVTEIAVDAFLDAENLTGVAFGVDSSLTIIRNSAFATSGLTSVSIPASVLRIEPLAFGLITSLGSVTFESGSSLESIGHRAFSDNPALTSVTFRGMIAPSAVSEDAFSRIGTTPKLFLEDGATGFGSVGDTWKGLLIATGGTIITPDPEPDPAPVSSSPAPAPVPPVATESSPASRSFSLDTPVLAKQQKKGLRTLIQEVGARGSFEVVAAVVREPGQTKKQAKALALAQARAIKKYLVLKGVKKRDVSLKTKIYKVGESPDTRVLVSKPNSDLDKLV